MAGDGTLDMVSKWLVIIGGLNWGIAGIGGLIKNATLNMGIVNLLLKSIPMLESLVYLLVGLSAAYMLFGMFKK